MRLLTLFLAFFLTILPESMPCADYCPQGQDVCFEEINDIEEEAVIRTTLRIQSNPQISSKPVHEVFNSASANVVKTAPVHHCFEKQWLTSCSLRL